MKKEELIFVGILLVALVTLVLYGNVNRSENATACFGESCFSVELAQSLDERGRGLMFRESLDENSGMLFVFPESGKHTFWMKNTLIPLDMIWIDENKRVTHIESNVPPCMADPCQTYTPSSDSLYVLEINSGLAEKNRIINNSELVLSLS